MCHSNKIKNRIELMAENQSEFILPGFRELGKETGDAERPISKV